MIINSFFRYQKLRNAAIVIQSHWRGIGPRRRYLAIAGGIYRLQARLRSRIVTHRFNVLRRRVAALQAYCKGFAVRQWVRQKIQVWSLRRGEE